MLIKKKTLVERDNNRTVNLFAIILTLLANTTWEGERNRHLEWEKINDKLGLKHKNLKYLLVY